MAAPLYSTLGERRAKLSRRLGFGASGAAAGVIQEHLNDILRESQVLLYWTHDWARLRRYWDISIGLNQYLVDYPDGCNPERIKAVSLNTGTSAAPVWSTPLKRGISASMYTTQASTAAPWRWEPYEQIEFFPKADKLYAGRVFGIKVLDDLTEDTHRFTIDDALVALVALGTAKGHYRQPDAKLHMDNAEALLVKLKAKSWGKDVFSPYDYVQDEPLAKPRVV